MFKRAANFLRYLIEFSRKSGQLMKNENEEEPEDEFELEAIINGSDIDPEDQEAYEALEDMIKSANEAGKQISEALNNATSKSEVDEIEKAVQELLGSINSIIEESDSDDTEIVINNSIGNVLKEIKEYFDSQEDHDDEDNIIEIEEVFDITLENIVKHIKDTEDPDDEINEDIIKKIAEDVAETLDNNGCESEEIRYITNEIQDPSTCDKILLEDLFGFQTIKVDMDTYDPDKEDVYIPMPNDEHTGPNGTKMTCSSVSYEKYKDEIIKIQIEYRKLDNNEI